MRHDPTSNKEGWNASHAGRVGHSPEHSDGVARRMEDLELDVSVNTGEDEILVDCTPLR